MPVVIDSDCIEALHEAVVRLTFKSPTAQGATSACNLLGYGSIDALLALTCDKARLLPWLGEWHVLAAADDVPTTRVIKSLRTLAEFVRWQRAYAILQTAQDGVAIDEEVRRRHHQIRALLRRTEAAAREELRGYEIEARALREVLDA